MNKNIKLKIISSSLLSIINALSESVAGGALLANILYEINLINNYGFIKVLTNSNL